MNFEFRSAIKENDVIQENDINPNTGKPVTLADAICNKKTMCYYCRNRESVRQNIFRSGFVDKVDFDCPEGIPLGAPMDAMPPETQAVLANRRRGQEALEMAPKIFRSLLRRVRTSQDKEQLETLVMAFYPDGLPPECIYKTVTNEWTIVRECKCKSRVIRCSCPHKDSSREKLVEKFCTPKDCEQFIDELE